MSYRDSISRARKNYSKIIPRTDADLVLSSFIKTIRDGITETAAGELTAREYTNSGAKLKHPASQATLDKLKSMVGVDMGDDQPASSITFVWNGEGPATAPLPPRTQLDRIEDKLDELIKLLKKANG